MKIIIILLFLPNFSSSYWFDCSPCNCLINENDLKTGNCNKNYNVPDLQEIPEKIDKEIKILKFKDQSLKILRQDHFGQFQNLHEIYLNKNKISVVHENALKGLSNLSKLDLSYNELSKLPINIFSNTPNLTYLWINNNKITSLQENLFSNLQSLNEIHLQENNIIEVSKNCFINVPLLSVIDLSYNNLQNLQLNIIDDSKSIKYFILHENPWICNKSFCEFRETALKHKWLTTIPDCNGKSWKDLKNYNVSILPKYGTVNEGANVVFSCEYYSCVRYELIWKSNHKDLKQTEAIQEGDKYISVLTLKNVDKSDEGQYTCSVLNCDDCHGAQVYLNINEIPKNSIKNSNILENTQTTKEIETTATNVLETTTEEAAPSSWNWSLILKISIPLIILLAIVLACCCCCYCCPNFSCIFCCLACCNKARKLCCKCGLTRLCREQKPEKGTNEEMQNFKSS